MIPKFIIFIVSALGLASCTFPDGSHLVTGAARQAIRAENVKLYFRPPAKFEEIAIVSASSKSQLAGDQRLIDSAIQRLKQEAAKVGANDVLFAGIATGQAGGSVHTFGGSNTFSNASVNAYSTGNGFSAYGTGTATTFNNAMSVAVPFITKNTTGRAIYVIREESGWPI